MTKDFDYLNYVTSTKRKEVNDKNVKPESHAVNKFFNPNCMFGQKTCNYSRQINRLKREHHKDSISDIISLTN